MKFEHRLEIEASPEQVWDLLMDIPTMSSCIPGVTGVTRTGDDTYDGQLTVKVGPIAAQFSGQVEVSESDPGARTAALQARAADRRLGSSVVARMAMAVTEADGGRALLSVDTDLQVLGRLGDFGKGILVRKADTMLEEFGRCVRGRLAG